jgi:hypothetical protein
VAGDEPQQAVSPGPGSDCPLDPEKEEWEEIIFFNLEPPQDSHCTGASARMTRISDTVPQSLHKNSYNGMIIFLLFF